MMKKEDSMASRLSTKRSMRFTIFALGLCLHPLAAAEEQPLRVAIVGTDTSHAVAFAKLINASDAEKWTKPIRVVAAFPGGSTDIPASIDRVGQFSQQLEKSGVALTDSIEAVVERADAILLESVDGRVHLEQFRQIATGKPVFIDKPAAASVSDFLQIMSIAKRTGTPFFSASALRFCNEVQQVLGNKTTGTVLAASTSTPYQREPHHPDLFWYGIHGVESLATLLGPGCETVRRHDTATGALVIGTWADGRQGAVWALSTHGAVYSCTLFGSKGVTSTTGFSGYTNLVDEIGKFFVTRQPPISPEQTLEILAIMEAADESQAHGGEPVAIEEIIRQAQEQVDHAAAESP